jgi:hypothetical protein
MSRPLSYPAPGPDNRDRRVGVPLGDTGWWE